jgi:exopolysaccharide production protein ExoQ
VVGSGLGLFGGFIHLLGRNETFTGRTDIWTMLWHWNINPIIGTGYEGFWLGDRREAVQDLYPGLNEAHNGYLETYLNLGALGVLITAAMLLATYGKCRRELFHNFEWGRFRMAYLLSFIVYNWTEAAFRLNALPFFMLFLVAMDYRPVLSVVVAHVNGSEEEIVAGASAPKIAWS